MAEPVRWKALALMAAAVPAAAQAWPTFYSAYEDGLSAQARGDHARAVLAFRRAIDLNPRPGRNVRTYGLNFMDVYAPYLRLAQSQLALGDLPGAEATLGQSDVMGLEPAPERQTLRARLQILKAKAAPTPAPRSSPAMGQVPPPASPPPEPKAPAVLQAPLNVTPVPAPSQPTPRPAVRESGRPEANLPQSGRSQGGPQNEPPPTPPTAPAPPAVRPAPPAAPPSWEKGGGVALLVLATLGGFLVRRRSRGGPSAAPAEPPGTTTEVVRPVADPSTARDPNLGRAFGRFTVQRVLGRGGCATAYFGVDPESGEEAAIKVPHPHLLDQEDFRARFHREAALGILLAHPRIVPMLDSSPEAGNPWLATRYIPGDTLSSHLHRHGPLGIPESVALAADVAEAIDFAHERGIVHRDLKPANIMVTPEGAMVMDFGIARITDGALTATTMFLGTPLYCAPEAVVSSRVGPAADWYALGIMLFEMVTGQVPFQVESSFQILESHRTRPLPDLLAIRPMTPPPLEGLIRRLCAKTPDERPSGREILETLGRLRTLYPPLVREAGQES